MSWISCALAFLCLATALCAAPVAAERTNYCDRAAAVANGSMLIKDALVGMNPSIAIYPGSIATYMAVNAQGKPTSGFLYNILQRVAVDGGFDWNYVVTPNPNVSDDIYLAAISKDYDTVAKVSFDTAVRRQKGLDFTPPLIDASIVLITDKSKTVSLPHSDVLIFMSPFSWDLWVAILVIIILHALCQMYIDYVELKKNKSDGADPPPSYKLWEYYFYVSFNTYHWRRHESAKRSGRILYTFFIFVMFVLATAYCGNLTSALILQNASIVKISNIDDANNLRANLCFRTGSAAINLVTSVYPNIQVTTSVNNSNQEVLDMLAAGKCDGAILALNDWLIVGQSKTNSMCNLVQTGSLVRQMTVHLPYMTDFNQYCTSLFGNTISNLMQNLTDQFVVQSMWNNAVNDAKQVDCGVLKLSTNLTNAKLTFSFLWGLFMIFGVVMGACLVLHTVASAFDWHALRAKWFPKYFKPADHDAVHEDPYQTFSKVPSNVKYPNDDEEKAELSMAANGGDKRLLENGGVLSTMAVPACDSESTGKESNGTLRSTNGTNGAVSMNVSEARRRFEVAYKDLMAAMANQ